MLPEPFLKIPVELFLLIAAYLNVSDILALRKTCRTFHRFSYERGLWLDQLLRIRSFLPFPSVAHNLDTLSNLEMEGIIFAALETERSWLLPRNQLSFLTHPDMPLDPSLIVLEFILESYLLTVYSEGQVYLWDIETERLNPSHPGKLCASYFLPNVVFSDSCVTHINSDNSTLHVAISTYNIIQTVILSVSLGQVLLHNDGTSSFKLVAVLPFGYPMILQDISPDSGLVLFLSITDMCVANWCTNNCVTISNWTENTRDVCNACVIMLRFCGSYIFCLRTHYIDIHNLPSTTTYEGITMSGSSWNLPHTPLLEYRFQHKSFVRGSISCPRPSLRQPHAYHFFLVALDGFRGLFHYSISFNCSSVPALNVDFVETLAFATYGGNSPHVNPHFPFDGIQLPPTLSGPGGFINGWCMGSQGRRGVWLERINKSEKCVLVAYTANIPAGGTNAVVNECAAGSSSLRGDRQTESGDARLPYLDGRVVFEVPAGLLQERRHLCALSQSTGRIALGGGSDPILII